MLSASTVERWDERRTAIATDVGALDWGFSLLLLFLTIGAMICCPMTSRIKRYVFEVLAGQTPPSAVLADRLKSLDWRARGAVHKGAVAPDVLADVQSKIKTLLRL